MTSVNKKEIDKFSKMADEWWDPEGKFKPLHKFNPTRIKYLKENIINNFKCKNKLKPLSGIKILDIGCGGGLLSEPMSRMGANVTGIDASDKNIQIAKLHAKKNKLKIVCLTAYSKNIAKILDKYCDIVLVGDSMANVLYGHKDMHKISLQNIIQHTLSVKKGVKKLCVHQVDPVRRQHQPHSQPQLQHQKKHQLRLQKKHQLLHLSNQKTVVQIMKIM